LLSALPCRPPLKRRVKELQAEAEQLVMAVKPWRPFSLAVPEDCSELLYEHLQLPPPPSATLGRRGKHSTKVRA
jgi:hypothetical protein